MSFCPSHCSLPDAPQTVWVNASQEVMEGSSVVLYCEVDSNPVSRISWHFGDEELLSDTTSNVSLYLEDLNPSQEGIYTCVGDNGYGVMNTSMYLAVKCELTHCLKHDISLAFLVPCATKTHLCCNEIQ